MTNSQLRKHHKYFTAEDHKLFDTTYFDESELPKRFPILPGASIDDRLRLLELWRNCQATDLKLTCQQIGSAVGLSRSQTQEISQAAIRKLKNKINENNNAH